MLRLFTCLCLALPLMACMTETDKKIWAEFKDGIKSDDAKESSAPVAQAEPSAEATPRLDEDPSTPVKVNPEAPASQEPVSK